MTDDRSPGRDLDGPDELDDGPDVGADEYGDIEAFLRELEAGDLEFERPPDSVWAGIAGQLDLRPPDAPSPPATADGATVVAGRFGRGRRWAAPLLAVAAAAMLIVAGVALTRSDSPTTIAHAELAFLPGFDEAGGSAAASADLVDDDGDEVIRIDDEALPFDLDEDASLELWLIEPDADGNVVDLVSLGDIEPDGARRFEIPAGYDPTVFSVVDISIEPHDGDAAHSGRSILRGALSA
jgi:anti-sigma-K factor RskA